MKLKAVLISKRYAPKWNGNLDLPASEQVVIVFRSIPGTADKQNFKSYKFGKGNDLQLIYNDGPLILTYVDKVENLDLVINGEIKHIKTGADLADANAPQLEGLFTEIRDYLFPENNDLDEGESEA